MSDIQKLLRRQTEWQKSRKSLSWPEKIRMAEAIRESVIQLRREGAEKLRSARDLKAGEKTTKG